MKCVRCGTETETGCAHLDCPHVDLYEHCVDAPKTEVDEDVEKWLEGMEDVDDEIDEDSVDDLNKDELEDHW